MPDIPSLKLTMLGTSGAGKTCFMLAMYDYLSMGVEGFLLAADPDQDVELQARWERLLGEPGANRWPPPTSDAPKTYDFELSYGFEPLLRFDWLDYRGGALRDRADAEDVQTLQARLRESDYVFVCVSGEYLRDKNARRRAGRGSGAGRILLHLREAARSMPKKVPVIIVVTKYDLCAAYLSREELVALVREMFSPLFVDGANWFTAITVFTLGHELESDRDGGKIRQEGGQVPAMFAIHDFFYEALRDVEAVRAGQLAKLNDLNRRWFGWLRRREKLQVQAVLARNRGVRASLAKSIRLIRGKLLSEGDVVAFYNGERVGR